MAAVLTLSGLILLAALFLLGERLGWYLHERHRRSREEATLASQQLAREISGRIRQHTDVGPVLNEAVVSLGNALAVDHVVVQLVRDGVLRAPSPAWASTGALGTGRARADIAAVTARRLESGLRDRLLRGRSIVSADVTKDPSYSMGIGRELVSATAARSLVATPVAAGGDLLALLIVVSSSRRREFTVPEVQLLESVAWSLGRALQSRLMADQQLALLDQLRELDRSKSEFVSSVSHELRTPLTSIAGYLEMLRDGDAGSLTDDQDDMLEIIQRNTARLQTLIEDLLTIGRIESGAIRLASEPVDLGGVVTDVRAAMAPLAGVGGVDLVVEPVPPGSVVQGDGPKLEQVVLNLVSNALKFTPSGGRVSVRAQVEGPDVVLIVQDTGIGIPRDEQPNLFSRFFRASNAAARAAQGAGLGLSIVEGIVVAHGGSIRVDSEEGVGTTVALRLPARRSQGWSSPGRPARDRPARERAAREQGDALAPL